METLSATESYSRVAGEYAAEFYHELDGKILDRTLLKRFAESVMGRAIACDLVAGRVRSPIIFTNRADQRDRHGPGGGYD
jgi:hypothetical protein